ncbi:hypothetical protein PIROE2DRAFT_16838, partial [Piromyces sp. E2]
FPKLSNINDSNEILYQSLKTKYIDITLKNKIIIAKSNERLYQSLKPFFKNINPNDKLVVSPILGKIELATPADLLLSVKQDIYSKSKGIILRKKMNSIVIKLTTNNEACVFLSKLLDDKYIINNTLLGNNKNFNQLKITSKNKININKLMKWIQQYYQICLLNQSKINQINRPWKNKNCIQLYENSKSHPTKFIFNPSTMVNFFSYNNYQNNNKILNIPKNYTLTYQNNNKILNIPKNYTLTYQNNNQILNIPKNYTLTYQNNNQILKIPKNYYINHQNNNKILKIPKNYPLTYQYNNKIIKIPKNYPINYQNKIIKIPKNYTLNNQNNNDKQIRDSMTINYNNNKCFIKNKTLFSRPFKYDHYIDRKTKIKNIISNNTKNIQNTFLIPDINKKSNSIETHIQIKNSKSFLVNEEEKKERIPKASINSSTVTLINKKSIYNKNNTQSLKKSVKNVKDNNSKRIKVERKRDKQYDLVIHHKKISTEKIQKRQKKIPMSLFELIKFEESQNMNILDYAKVLDYNDCIVIKN